MRQSMCFPQLKFLVIVLRNRQEALQLVLDFEP
jgi:hypothetical protein